MSLLAPTPHSLVPPSVTVFAQAPIKMDFVEHPPLSNGENGRSNVGFSEIPEQTNLVQFDPVVIRGMQIGRADAGRHLPVTIAPSVWSSRLEKEFQSLAELEIMGTASDAERAKLNELLVLRRQIKNPRPAEEVLFEMRREVMLGELIQMFDRYVRFINLGPGPNPGVVELARG